MSHRNWVSLRFTENCPLVTAVSLRIPQQGESGGLQNQSKGAPHYGPSSTSTEEGSSQELKRGREVSRKA